MPISTHLNFLGAQWLVVEYGILAQVVPDIELWALCCRFFADCQPTLSWTAGSDVAPDWVKTGVLWVFYWPLAMVKPIMSCHSTFADDTCHNHIRLKTSVRRDSHNLRYTARSQTVVALGKVHAYLYRLARYIYICIYKYMLWSYYLGQVWPICWVIVWAKFAFLYHCLSKNYK